MLDKLRNFIDKNQRRVIESWEIDFDELKNRSQNGAILLDVRSIQEYNEGHLYGAIHLADYDIAIKHNLVIKDKNKEIIVYCQNGGRSKKAYKKLKKLGYLKVYSLYGGLDNITQ